MVEKIIRIKVDAGDVDEIAEGLEQLGANFDVVEAKTANVGKELQTLGKSSFVFEQLNKLTGGLAGNVVDVYNGVVRMNKGLKATKLAIAATGIGLLVVAVGLLVTYWDEIEDSVLGISQLLQSQIKDSERYLEVLESELKILTTQEKILKLQGESTVEIKEQKKIIILQQQAENALLLENLKLHFEREKGLVKEVTLWEKIKIAAAGVLSIEQQTKQIKDATQGDEDERKRLQEIEDQLQSAKLRAEELKLLLLEIDQPEKQGRTKNREKIDRVDTLTGEDSDAQLQKEQELFEELFDLKKIQQDQLNALVQSGFDFTKEQDIIASQNAFKQAKYREWLAKKEAQAKTAAYHIAADGFAAASDLIGKETAAGKAMAIASTIISTYLSAQQAFQSQLSLGPAGPYLGAAAAAAAIIGGLARVKSILSVKIPGQGGGGGSVGVGGGVPSTPPAFNVVGNSPQNQLNEALISGRNEPIEAFVLEGAVTSGQALTRGKIEESSLGG